MCEGKSRGDCREVDVGDFIGYVVAICGVVMYIYFKAKDVGASHLPLESIADRIAREIKMEKKSSDLYLANDLTMRKSHISDDGGSGDEEAPLIPSSRLMKSYMGQSPLSNHSTLCCRFVEIKAISGKITPRSVDNFINVTHSNGLCWRTGQCKSFCALVTKLWLLILPTSLTCLMRIEKMSRWNHGLQISSRN